MALYELFLFFSIIQSSFVIYSLGHGTIKPSSPAFSELNAIDKCWRTDFKWIKNRQMLAKCSVGFSGKMTNNMGKDVTEYIVTDPSDDQPISPKPGTLRYGVTRLTKKTWITFNNDMIINLKRPLVIGSYTTIDGRGASVKIVGAGLLIFKVTNVIIHNLHIYDCMPTPAGQLMVPGEKIVHMGPSDGDAISVISSTKVWIDHNTLSKSYDGLIDVILGSTNITISNNRFHDHDKVILLGNDDGVEADENMKVTVVFNHFGPNCNQRMPRVRWGYAHVVNNVYEGWSLYAIGGSMHPSIMSESNVFVASNSGSKAIDLIVKPKNGQTTKLWSFQSVNDLFENGAFLQETDETTTNKPNYNNEQIFLVADARSVKSLTGSAGAIDCHGGLRC